MKHKEGTNSICNQNEELQTTGLQTITRDSETQKALKTRKF